MIFNDDIISIEGRSFRVETPYDDSGETPWDNDCGSGIVSDWTTRDKKPGEMLLVRDRLGKRYYDFAGTMAIAKRDGWSIRNAQETMTNGQRAEAAVKANYERLREWCNDEWHYIGVVVTLLDDDGEATDHVEALWGIESDCYDYIAETAGELANQILSDIAHDEATKATYALAYAGA